MHESGLIRQLIQTALDTAIQHNAELQGIDVRIGVLAGGSAEHLHEHFEQEVARLGLAPITLNMVEEPEFLGGIEIESIELSGERP